jgi:hypothetical protein
MKFEDEKAVLEKLGLDFEILDSGCCGMAGAFGFERGDKYQVSIKCGERVLLPRVRGAAKDTLIIANGFSCREQISQTTNRRALHLAEILHTALSNQSHEIAGNYPERKYAALHQPNANRGAVPVALLAGSGAALAMGLILWRRNRRQRATDKPQLGGPGGEA